MDTNGLIGDVEPVCDRPRSPDLPIPIVVSDCGGSSPEIGCSCCVMCCEDGKQCNDDNLVPSNDPMWQFSYDRVFYSFGNFTGYFMAVDPET